MESGGAPGATMSAYTCFSSPETGSKKSSPAREACSMIVSTGQVASILRSFEEAGVFAHAGVYGYQTREILRAFSYSAK
jgi:hypothetical protein